MPRLDTNFRFAEKKATTVPVVKLPRNVKSALCINAVHANGIFKIEPMSGMATYDQCYIFEDINYKNQDEEKKDSTLLQIMKWLKSMNTQFKITVANEQRDMEKFMEEIFHPAAQGGICGHGAGDRAMDQPEDRGRDQGYQADLISDRYLQGKIFEEAAVFFATLDTSLQSIFSALKADCTGYPGKKGSQSYSGSSGWEMRASSRRERR